VLLLYYRIVILANATYTFHGFIWLYNTAYWNCICGYGWLGCRL